MNVLPVKFRNQNRNLNGGKAAHNVVMGIPKVVHNVVMDSKNKDFKDSSEDNSDENQYRW